MCGLFELGVNRPEFERHTVYSNWGLDRLEFERRTVYLN